MALLVIIGFATGNADADDAEFDFRFDEPSDGEGSVDPVSTSETEDTTVVDLAVAIENFLKYCLKFIIPKHVIFLSSGTLTHRVINIIYTILKSNDINEHTMTSKEIK